MPGQEWNEVKLSLIKVCDRQGWRLARPDASSAVWMMSRNEWGDNRERSGLKFKAGENGRTLWKTFPRPRLFHHESYMSWPRIELGALAVECYCCKHSATERTWTILISNEARKVCDNGVWFVSLICWTESIVQSVFSHVSGVQSTPVFRWGFCR